MHLFIKHVVVDSFVPARINPSSHLLINVVVHSSVFLCYVLWLLLKSFDDKLSVRHFKLVLLFVIGGDLLRQLFNPLPQFATCFWIVNTRCQFRFCDIWQELALLGHHTGIILASVWRYVSIISHILGIALIFVWHSVDILLASCWIHFGIMSLLVWHYFGMWLTLFWYHIRM